MIRREPAPLLAALSLLSLLFAGVAGGVMPHDHAGPMLVRHGPGSDTPGADAPLQAGSVSESHCLACFLRATHAGQELPLLQAAPGDVSTLMLDDDDSPRQARRRSRADRPRGPPRRS